MGKNGEAKSVELRAKSKSKEEEMPGCVSQGNTRAEALKDIQDAIKGYIESLKKHNEPIPPPIEEEIGG